MSHDSFTDQTGTNGTVDVVSIHVSKHSADREIMSLTDITIPEDIALNTDLYELTMAQGLFESGMAQNKAAFSVYFRDNPFKGGYAISCGTAQIADMVENFHFDSEALSYLASLKAPAGGPLFSRGFLGYLEDFRLSLDIWAVPEGEVVFAREPIAFVEGPLIDCQLIETALLNLVNFQTLVATKCSRVVQAAQGRSVFDFGLRRAQGPDGGLAVARASFVGGAVGTSNCLAGKMYDIPVIGTHAHSWVMAFPDELEAFRAYARSAPSNCVLLVDTYNVEQGIQNALIVAKEMEGRGERLMGIRIDSGDLARLSKRARQVFDAAGLDYVKISASNDLDEYTIQSLMLQGAPIDSFGVGTKLATCDPQPSLGGVYKLCATKRPGEKWMPTMKLSEQAYKRTIPGLQRVYRFCNREGVYTGDIIVDNLKDSHNLSYSVDVLDTQTIYPNESSEYFQLLEPVVKEGASTGITSDVHAGQLRAQRSLARLDGSHKRFLNPQLYPVGLENSLNGLRCKLAFRTLTQNLGVFQTNLE